MFKKSFLFLFVLSLFCGAASGQTTIVKGHFLKDSIKLGETVPYVLTARYPRELNVIFPDSTYSFAPFEIESKKFFTTHTVDNQSYDSVIYTLSSFEIDSIQKLGLPVFVLHQRDCTIINATPDSIFLKEIVTHVPDSVSVDKLALKTNTAYLDVKWLLNYPIVLIVLGIVIALAIGAWFVFRKQIKRYFKVKRLTRSHQTFTTKYNALVQSDFTYVKSESAVVVWKNYMETLTGRPFAKYTSKEIIRLQKDEQLRTMLYAIDRMVYGKSELSAEPFVQLRDYTDQLFRKKLEEVNHG